MAPFIRDFSYALRLIRKSPQFAVSVIAPLALGIGLNGAIFLLVDALLLRPLPVRNPGELVRLVQVVQNLGPRSYYTYDTLRALREKSTSFSDIAGYSDWNAAVRDASGASRIRAQVVTGNFFSTLGVSALYGRVLTAADELQPAARPPIVLSYPYWRQQFHSDPNAIGQNLILEDQPFVIVGVMPRTFNGVEVETTPDIRVPLIATGLLTRGNPDVDSYLKLEYSLIARLRNGIGLGRAQAEAQGIVNATQEVEQRMREAARDEHLEVQSISKGVSLIRPKFASALVLLMSGVGLLLLMICANVGGLLLARTTARREEIAVRLAIGGTTGRLLSQFLTESLVLTLIGGVAGLGLAILATPLLIRAIPVLRDLGATALTLSLDIRPHMRFYLFAIALCFLCALFAGMPAALQATRGNLHTALRTARGTRRQPLRWALVALQIGLCTFLLAGAGLLISTFQHLRSLDPGFDRDHIVTFSLDPDMAHYTPQQSTDLRTRLADAARQLPGVQAAAVSVIGLMRGTGMKMTVAPEGEIASRSDFLNTSLNSVTPEYFETMGIPLLEGRNFRSDEPDSKPQSIIVNRAFVRRFFPKGDPLGRRVGSGIAKVATAEFEVIGVVGDAKYRNLREVIPPTIYRPFHPDLKYTSAFILNVRTKNRPDAIIQPVRRALNKIDPRLPFYEVHTLAGEVDATLWAERLLAWLSAVFSGVAAVLATLGVYATLAYAIAQSRREIGIRVALGAGAGDILRRFSARPLRYAALGMTLGIAGFWAATPAFRSLLYEVSSSDPRNMVAASAAVLLIALVSTLIAAGGALRLDPAAVLREE